MYSPPYVKQPPLAAAPSTPTPPTPPPAAEAPEASGSTGLLAFIGSWVFFLFFISLLADAWLMQLGSYQYPALRSVAVQIVKARSAVLSVVDRAIERVTGRSSAP